MLRYHFRGLSSFFLQRQQSGNLILSANLRISHINRSKATKTISTEEYKKSHNVTHQSKEPLFLDPSIISALKNGDPINNKSKTSTEPPTENIKKGRIESFFSMLSPDHYVHDPNYLKVKGNLMTDDIFKKMKAVPMMESLGLPDTYNSWYRLFELHIWMVSIRIMRDSRFTARNRYIRDSVIFQFYKIVEEKAKDLKLGPSMRRKAIKNLSDEFKVALIFYDEALLTSDQNLASALWMRFYDKSEDVDPICLELLISYIHRNLKMLDDLTDDQFINKGESLNFLPLETISDLKKIQRSIH